MEDRIQWVRLPQYIIPMLLTLAFWQWTGSHAVFFIAGISGMDRSVLEAATVDGANAWQRTRYIVVPLLKPVIAFISITAAAGSLTLYEVPAVLFTNGGGPAGQGWFFMPYIVYTAFSQFRMGYATTIGWLVFFLAVIVTLIQLRLYDFGEVNQYVDPTQTYGEVFHSGQANPYHTALLEATLGSLPASAAVDVEATDEVLRVLMQRALIEMHTFIPDAEDIEGWFELIFARQQRFYVDLERYAAAVADPDPEKVKRFITDVNFYDRGDPIIVAARAIQQGNALTADDVRAATQATASSHDAQALQLGYGYLAAASDFFTGAIEQDRLHERLDIGKMGCDGIGV